MTGVQACAPPVWGRSDPGPASTPSRPLRGRPAAPVVRRPVGRADETAALDREPADLSGTRDVPPLRVGLSDPKAETRPVPLPPPDPDELPWWRRPQEPADD
ncbi:hypothetical protein [Agromyces seonyuensis]|uniref:Uncharacterized protein n=1 Tax=Agromyces seonyuensis TaxID=2662446 RepID=A0A6I4P1C2_9MICO|nr:hypothetical protein [Agromyces seonyuensis]MWC00411.1 hypothetical protein [Agromyces seonyuensis]